MSSRAPIWFLLLATPLVIESCLTAATPPSHWLNPGIALLLVFAYGPFALWSREMWVRRALPLRALFLFGLAYGFFNEGILAHTLTQTNGEPITHFIGYDEAAGLHWGWMSLIVPWHAFFSITYMVLLAHLWFPAQSAQPWLSSRMLKLTGALCLVMMGLYFVITTPDRPAPPGAFPFYLFAMGSLMALGLRLKTVPMTARMPTRFKGPVLQGFFLASLVTIAGFELAHNKAPLPLYLLFTLGLLAVIWYKLGHIAPSRLLAFMLGGSIGLALFAVLVGADPLRFITAPAYIAFAILSLRRLSAASAPTPWPAPA